MSSGRRCGDFFKGDAIGVKFFDEEFFFQKSKRREFDVKMVDKDRCVLKIDAGVGKIDFFGEAAVKADCLNIDSRIGKCVEHLFLEEALTGARFDEPDKNCGQSEKGKDGDFKPFYQNVCPALA